MKQTMRWFGPGDPVSLKDIRQAGCSGVVTALHHIPNGEVWTRSEILKRKKQIEEENLTWDVVESLPVHEDIKTQTGQFETYIENYKKSISNLAACGIDVITYNFMPVLDWTRTDLAYILPDGAKTLRFERAALIAFELFILKHPVTEKHYSKEDIKKAEHLFEEMNEEQRSQLQHNILSGLPGSEETFSLDRFREKLELYKRINIHRFRQYLFYFLQEIMPVADECNVKMAIHPDDPPHPILGLPRIVSTAADLNLIFEAAPSMNNGLCFCSGSLGVRKLNDLQMMVKEFEERIHFVHLRNIYRSNRDFWETPHLDGSIDMYAVVKQICWMMQKREVSIPMRPDHGLQILDDLHKDINPGYSAIGRLKGLAELRGLELGILRSLMDV